MEGAGRTKGDTQKDNRYFIKKDMSQCYYVLVTQTTNSSTLLSRVISGNKKRDYFQYVCLFVLRTLQKLTAMFYFFCKHFSVLHQSFFALISF